MSGVGEYTLHHHCPILCHRSRWYLHTSDVIDLSMTYLNKLYPVLSAHSKCHCTLHHHCPILCHRSRRYLHTRPNLSIHTITNSTLSCPPTENVTLHSTTTVPFSVTDCAGISTLAADGKAMGNFLPGNFCSYLQICLLTAQLYPVICQIQ